MCMTSIPIALTTLLAAAFLRHFALRQHVVDELLGCTWPQHPPPSCLRVSQYLFLFTASPAFADAPRLTCVHCLATTDVVARHTSDI
jgi:hypothetical protein